jgi:hypothetical protein
MTPRLGVALLTACVAAAAGGGAVAGAATTGVDLGQPNYDGYCQHLGFERSTIANARYECKHADGSTSPIDLQAACEFSFTQRPILAENPHPPVIFSLHCYQTSSAEGGGPPGSKRLPRVTRARVDASMLAALVPSGRAAKIAALLRRGGYATRFASPSTGGVVLSWYLVPNGAHLARGTPTPTLVATGRASFSRAGSAQVMIRLTARGRQLLKHARRLKLTGKGTFSESGFASEVQRAVFTLKQ